MKKMMVFAFVFSLAFSACNEEDIELQNYDTKKSKHEEVVPSGRASIANGTFDGCEFTSGTFQTANPTTQSNMIASLNCRFSEVSQTGYYGWSEYTYEHGVDLIGKDYTQMNALVNSIKNVAVANKPGGSSKWIIVSYEQVPDNTWNKMYIKFNYSQKGDNTADLYN